MSQETQIKDEDRAAILRAARKAYPIAIPLADAFVERNQLAIASLPEAVSQLGFGEVKASENPTEIRQESEEVAQATVLDSAVLVQTVALQTSEKKERITASSSLLSIDDFRENGARVEPLMRRQLDSDIIRATRDETNKGVSPNSRKYIRGVLHRHPGRVRIASLGFIFCYTLVLLSFLPLFLIFIDKEKFFWVIYSPALFIPALAIYLLIVSSASCPVCRQKQYVHKICHKHVKAHHIPIIGYMLPTAVHIIFYKWFRCIFCGTAVRLKE